MVLAIVFVDSEPKTGADFYDEKAPAQNVCLSSSLFCGLSFMPQTNTRGT
jgi:hypothetical protein